MNVPIKNQKSKIRSRKLPRAFTLVELLVAIAIIIILVGIGITVGPGVMGNSDRAATRTLIDNAHGIITEYEVQTRGQVVNHLANVTTPFDWTVNKPQNTGPDMGVDEDLGGNTSDDLKQRSIERFVWATFQVPDIRANMYSNMPESVLVDLDQNGFLELRDRWDTKLIYAAFVDYDDANNADNFLPEHSVPYIASAGPDGEWGNYQDLEDQLDTVAAEEAADNLYSFGQGE